MKNRASLRGFAETRTVPLEELGGVLRQYEHKQTGAQLCWLDRPEENKTFAIAFRTIPQDDTGVFHILEHSVLCGSDKYPVKEPFVELLKSSLNTFLNAFTFPDKTMYPVSSRNQEDFQNLVSVYLDAVFHPLIYRKPEIFRQEGWHYEVENGLSYKGVVFNEMKGAMASADSLMEAACSRKLFPDNCYRYNSGGDPVHIPELSYQGFLAAHRKYYHPSNALIFLDGSLDPEPVFTLLDEALAPYSRAETLPEIPFQHPVDGGREVAAYELSSSEPLEGRCRLGMAFGAGTFRDREKLAALYALSDVLCGDNQAPLKRRLLDMDLAKDVTFSIYDGVQQPWILLEARDIREEQEEETVQTLIREIQRLVEEGLDHRRLEATLDNLEFQARQRDYGRMPQGLMLGFQVMESWLYGGQPEANLEVADLYENLRKKLQQGYFEKLLASLLLENPHTCRVVLKPSHSLGKEREEEETRRLEAAAASWKAEERRTLLEQQKQVEIWQQTPDDQEVLDTLPRIRLDQIRPDPEALPTETLNIGGVPVLCHRTSTGGILHLNLYFALDDLAPEDLPGASFLAQLLTNVPTQNHSLEDLQREIRAQLGTLYISLEAYEIQGRTDRCRVFLTVQCSLLEQKLEGALELLEEILTRSCLNQGETVYPFLCQRRAQLVDMACQNGHNTAMCRVMARSLSEGVVQELAGGVSFLEWLRDLEQHFKEQFPSLGEKLLSLAGKVFVRSRLTLSVTCENSRVAQKAVDLFSGLSLGSYSQPEICPFQPWERKREGIVIPGDVSYCAMGGVFPAAGNGCAKVMSHVLSLEHLWNRVRVQGGAYGTGMVVRESGFAGFYSYRDPTAVRTVGCFEESAQYLRGLSGEDMTGRIIGTIAEQEPVLTSRLMGRVADGLYWRGITQADRCRRRGEILKTTGEDLVSLGDLLEKLHETASLCVVGSRSQMEACGALLDEVTEL